jgi:ethanolamine transporter EutH
LFREGTKALQTTVVTLLLITTSVVFACVVIDYAVSAIQNTLNTSNIPQLDRIKSIESNLMNQTDAFSGTQPQLPGEPSP